MVMYYNTQNPAKARLVKETVARLGIRIRDILPEQVNETVGALAGIKEAETYSETGWNDFQFRPVIQDEVLIFYNFSEERLDELLRELRKIHASVALKAVVTPTNCSWRFWQLYAEIKKEHEEMTRQIKAEHPSDPDRTI